MHSFDPEQVRVTDEETGQSILVPKYNSVTCFEHRDFWKFVSQQTQEISGVLATFEYQCAIVAMFLRHRFNLAADVPEEEIFRDKEGQVYMKGLIEKLYEFFISELKLNPKEEDQEVTEEVAKKQKRSTGTKSTTKSNSIIQMRNDLEEETLGDAQSA